MGKRVDIILAELLGNTTYEALLLFPDMSSSFFRVSKTSSYLLFVGVLFLVQFVPLIFDMKLRESALEESIRSDAARVIAGFGTGVLVLILMDLLVDVLLGKYDLWLSRSGYFWLALIQCSLILFFAQMNRIGAIYISYSAAVLVFYYGRAFLDLCRFDTTRTWTYMRSTCLLVILALGHLSVNLDFHFGTQDSHILAYIGVGFIYLYELILILNFTLCLVRLYLKYPSKPMIERFNSLTHEETIVAFVCVTLGACTLGLFILPFASIGSTNHARHTAPLNIVGDILIRSVMACSLALLPSVLLKHKAQFLQQDLDMKSLFVRNVSHEIRTPLNIAVVGLDILMRSRLNAPVRNGEEEEMVEEIMDSCKGTHYYTSSLFFQLWL